MRTAPRKDIIKKPGINGADNVLFHLAFNNTAQANIISNVVDGKIVVANRAACKLLGYSKKELITKKRAQIFDIRERGFKKMLKERTAEGHSTATVKAIKKTGNRIFCEITSATFFGKDHIEKTITSIADLSAGILKQEIIDAEKEKIAADNIVIAKSTQRKIDIKNQKAVASNIVIAKSVEKKIALEKRKIVDINIAVALSRQKVIDKKNKKIVAENIHAALAESDAVMAANNKWIKHIAETSYDVMWDWDVSSGKVYVGESFKEVFGYHVKNNSTSFFELRKNLLKGMATSVFRNFQKTLASCSKTWSDSFSIVRQDGALAFVNSRATIVRNADGKAIRMIGAMRDVTNLRDLQIKTSKLVPAKKGNSDVFQLAAKLSYDGIWDWNIITGEFFLGEGFEQLFGFVFDKESNAALNWSDFLHPDDKAGVEKGLKDALESSASSWEDTYRFIRTDGSVINVFGRASIIRDEGGRASRLIGVIHDLSRQKNLEEMLAQQNETAQKHIENFRLMFNSSSDVLYDIDLATDEIVLSDGFKREFGYEITPHMKVSEVWIDHLHPDDKPAVLKEYHRMLASKETNWKYSYRFIRSDGSFANILSRRIILRTGEGIPYRMIGSMQDVSQQKVLEGKLEQEIKLKELQIQDAMEDAKETERSDIGRELHDNVNQLLSVSRLYLEMAKGGGKESGMYFSRSSEYTLSAIEEIRKLTKGLTSEGIKDIGLCNSIKNLARVTREVNPVKITCKLDPSIENIVHDKFKLNVLRIIQEQLNNIQKHAHAKKVTITLSRKLGFITLVVSDDGVGFDITRKRKGIGIDNIKRRATAYKGHADIASHPGKGCILSVSFKIKDISA